MVTVVVAVVVEIEVTVVVMVAAPGVFMDPMDGSEVVGWERGDDAEGEADGVPCCMEGGDDPKGNADVVPCCVEAGYDPEDEADVVLPFCVEGLDDPKGEADAVTCCVEAGDDPEGKAGAAPCCAASTPNISSFLSSIYTLPVMLLNCSFSQLVTLLIPYSSSSQQNPPSFFFHMKLWNSGPSVLPSQFVLKSPCSGSVTLAYQPAAISTQMPKASFMPPSSAVLEWQYSSTSAGC
jgi:hypothetical protein